MRWYFLVETIGIEPMTPCMSSMYSNQLSYASLSTGSIIPHTQKKSNPFFKKIFVYFLLLTLLGTVHSEVDMLYVVFCVSRQICKAIKNIIFFIEKSETK